MARVPYVSQDDLDPDYEEYLVYEGKTLNVHRATGNNQELIGAFDDFLEALYEHAGLSDRERELIILTVAATTGAEYQWHNHVWLAQELGVSEAEIEAIAHGDRSRFPTHEQALIAYARGVAYGQIQEPLHEAVAEHFDTATIVGIAMLAAAYVAVGRVLDALDVDIEDGEDFTGWSLS